MLPQDWYLKESIKVNQADLAKVVHAITNV